VNSGVASNRRAASRRSRPRPVTAPLYIGTRTHARTRAGSLTAVAALPGRVRRRSPRSRATASRQGGGAMRAARCASSKNGPQASPSARRRFVPRIRITWWPNRFQSGLRKTPAGAAIVRHSPQGRFSARSPRRSHPDVPPPRVIARRTASASDGQCRHCDPDGATGAIGALPGDAFWGMSDHRSSA
jgi:hypothetical protein